MAKSHALNITHGLSIHMFHDEAIIQQLKQSQDDTLSHLKLDLLLSDAFYTI